jgi:hypothetical protein
VCDTPLVAVLAHTRVALRRVHLRRFLIVARMSTQQMMQTAEDERQNQAPLQDDGMDFGAMLNKGQGSNHMV